jgi:hypothetical protein
MAFLKECNECRKCPNGLSRTKVRKRIEMAKCKLIVQNFRKIMMKS